MSVSPAKLREQLRGAKADAVANGVNFREQLPQLLRGQHAGIMGPLAAAYGLTPADFKREDPRPAAAQKAPAKASPKKAPAKAPAKQAASVPKSVR